MSYLVDTDWAIDYLNGQDRTRERLEKLKDSGLGLSIISLAEVYEGHLLLETTPKGTRKHCLIFCKAWRSLQKEKRQEK